MNHPVRRPPPRKVPDVESVKVYIELKYVLAACAGSAVAAAVATNAFDYQVAKKFATQVMNATAKQYEEQLAQYSDFLEQQGLSERFARFITPLEVIEGAVIEET